MRFFLTFCVCLLALGAIAQPGISEMKQATQDLTSSFFSAFDCSIVLAGIVGIFGALRVYHNWQMGKKEIIPDLAAWFFAALFIILSGVFLRALFGI